MDSGDLLEATQWIGTAAVPDIEKLFSLLLRVQTLPLELLCDLFQVLQPLGAWVTCP